MSLSIKPDPDKEDRKDPTFFLPEEEMSYEIKKKKKKKKKKQEDPFKDIEEKIREPALTALDPDIGAALDPEVTIKVENIEVELDINDFSHMDDGYPDNNENSQPEPFVKFEQQNKEAVLLTFESVISDKILYGEPIDSIEFGHGNDDDQIDEPPELAMSFLCKICHLVFKTQKTLIQHQKRMHKKFRRSFKHKCEHCGMQYEFKNSLEAHKKRRHSPDAVIDDMKERTCEICALVFKGINRLRMHMRRTHGSFEDAFKHVCQDCGLTYDKTQSLLVHRKRKHDNVKKPKVNQWFNCMFCPKVFTRRETYTRHVQRKHKVDDDLGKGIIKSEKSDVGETTCKFCSLVFSSVNYLNWHLRRKHNVKIEDYKLKCKICNLSYNKVESLKRHIKRKHTHENYCSVCCKQFTSKITYMNHTHVKQVQECNLCGQIFAHQGGLAKHLRCTHKIESPATVFCHICNKGFYSKKYLKSHMIRVHFKVTYHCKLCDKNFKAKESYRRHMIVKHPNDNDLEVGPKHMCEKCPEGFRNEFELAKHINIVHNEPEFLEIKKEEDDLIKTSFKCTKCTEEFATWEQLRTHFGDSHHLTEEVQCQICGDLMSRSDLQKHIKIHDEIEVQCKYCEFKTKNKVSMTQHLLRHKNSETLNCDYPLCRYKTFYEDAMSKHKKKHEASAKLQCASCPFQTMNKYILRYHEEAHVTGKKRYSCDQCDYATILPANLVQHKYKHSNEKRFKCEVCPFATKYNTSLRFHVRKKHCDLPTFS